MNQIIVTALRDATSAHCGGKAATLGTLLRAGLPVPPGFVVPFAVRRAVRGDLDPWLPGAVRRELARALAKLGDPPVAVRSSAASEDTAGASAAGQYESILAVQGADAVGDAVRACWSSAGSARVAAYRSWSRDGEARAEPEMAVIVQRLVDADVSGVMFTPTSPDVPTRIEASWGLGLAVVGGTVTPDAHEVRPAGVVRRSIGTKTTRTDRGENRDGLRSSDVPAHQRAAPTLDDPTALRLAALGDRVAELLGGPQDIEWAIADGATWLLQARPVTAPLPPTPVRRPVSHGAVMGGTPGAHGVVTGSARLVRSPGDFGRVQPGDIVVCPYTDPAWTPLFRIAAGVVTETGGALSHAAIVAREYGIPAALGIPHATTRLRDGARVTLDGTAGTLTVH